MTTTINASTSSGLVNTADTSGILQLQTASTAALTINASQQVGIGTASPAYNLDVVGTTPIINIQGGATTNARGIQFNYNGANIIGSVLSYGGTGELSVSAGNVSSAGYFITFKTYGVERMRVGDTGNVGIGTTTPLSKLDITSSNGTDPNADGASFLRLTNTATGANSTSGVGFYASLSGTQFQTAYIQSVATFNSNADSMLAFGTRSTSGAATERMRILSTGNILSLAGGSTTATGTGIAFPATQDASSFANVLDDYEEGTWTPVLTFGGASVAMSYTYQYGFYDVSNKRKLNFP